MTYMQLALEAKQFELDGNYDQAADKWFDARNAAVKKDNYDWAEGRWMFCRKRAMR